MNDVAVLIMAYGAPNSESDIEAYLTDIMEGRKPTPKAVQVLKERYRRIGGRSPLLDITLAQASALEGALNSQGLKSHVYVGMKHWHPYIGEVVPQIIGRGVHKIIALVLAPHYSAIGVGGYKQALDRSLKGVDQVRIDFIDSWCENPIFHQAVAERITSALEQFQPSTRVEVLFTAHSLPERILGDNDPYPKQLPTSCQAVANLLKIDHWSLVYQSAGHTDEKWLGPDILEALTKLSSRVDHSGNVLVVPIGFVADNLEILYDIDVEAQEFAKAHGLNLRRTESLNTCHTFISALADIVQKRVDSII